MTYTIELTPREAYEQIRDYFSQSDAELSYHCDEKSSKVCDYRHEEDGKVRKCAIGCLIPDEAYDSRMERRTLDILMEPDGRWGLKKPLLSVPNPRTVAFLRKAQPLHDNAVGLSHFLYKLDRMWIDSEGLYWGAGVE